MSEEVPNVYIKIVREYTCDVKNNESLNSIAD
jgi:hypothetical protein